MVIPFKVSVDTKNIERRLKKTTNELSKSGQKNVSLIGRSIRDKLKLYSPKKSGEAARSIMITNISNTRNKNQLVVSQGFLPHPDKRWKGRYFNLVTWMFLSSRAYSHFKTGNIRAFRNVIPDARNEFSIRVRNDINKIIKAK